MLPTDDGFITPKLSRVDSRLDYALHDRHTSSLDLWPGLLNNPPYLY